jgi:hypothetical protein
LYKNSTCINEEEELFYKLPNSKFFDLFCFKRYQTFRNKILYYFLKTKRTKLSYIFNISENISKFNNIIPFFKKRLKKSKYAELKDYLQV